VSCSLALLGYFIYRQLRPDTPRPFRLPTFAKWVALGVFIVWAFIYFFGGWNSPKIILADPHQGPGLYLLGILIVALYAPLYWWRRWQDRRLAAAGRLPGQLAPVAAVPDGSGPAEPAASPDGESGPGAGPQPSGRAPVTQ